MPERQQISRKHRWKVQGRLAVLEYAAAHGLKPAAERFALDRKTVREWRDRAKAAGEVGLVPRYPKRRARRIPASVPPHRGGAPRVALGRLPHAPLASPGPPDQGGRQDHRADLRGSRLYPRAKGAKAPRRAPRQLKLFEKATPGESVQVDVKVVTVNGTKAYQYTACDDCTRYRVLRLFPRLNARTSVDFLAELRQVLPFSIQKVQTDHGTEFSFDFVLAVELAGLRHRYIKPRRPQQNGKVERSHRIDNEEFWSCSTFGSFAEDRGRSPCVGGALQHGAVLYGSPGPDPCREAGGRPWRRGLRLRRCPCSRTAIGSRARAVALPGRELGKRALSRYPPKHRLLAVSVGDQPPDKPPRPAGVPFLTTENTSCHRRRRSSDRATHLRALR